MGKTVAASFDTVADRLQQLLGARGFHLQFDIDLAEQLRQEAGARFPRYHILGACHLRHMARALAAEPQLGLLFPCHLIHYEDHTGQSVVLARDPARIMDLLRHPVAIETAMLIRDELEALLEEL